MRSGKKYIKLQMNTERNSSFYVVKDTMIPQKTITCDNWVNGRSFGDTNEDLQMRSDFIFHFDSQNYLN